MEEKLFDTKYILPIYEHKKVNDKEFIFIKYFVGYKVLSHKEVDRARRHISKADLKVKILTGNHKNEIYNANYMCSTDVYMNCDYLLSFGGNHYFDKVCMYERDNEALLFDYDIKYDLRMPSLDENGNEYASTSLSVYFNGYMSAEDLQKLQDKYNEAIETLYNKEKQKDAVKPAEIF